MEKKKERSCPWCGETMMPEVKCNKMSMSKLKRTIGWRDVTKSHVESVEKVLFYTNFHLFKG